MGVRLGRAGAGLARVRLGGIGLGGRVVFARLAWTGLCRVCLAGLGGAGLCRTAWRRVRWAVVGSHKGETQKKVRLGPYLSRLFVVFDWVLNHFCVNTSSTHGRNKPEKVKRKLNRRHDSQSLYKEVWVKTFWATCTHSL